MALPTYQPPKLQPLCHILPPSEPYGLPQPILHIISLPTVTTLPLPVLTFRNFWQCSTRRSYTTPVSCSKTPSFALVLLSLFFFLPLFWFCLLSSRTVFLFTWKFSVSFLSPYPQSYRTSLTTLFALLLSLYLSYDASVLIANNSLFCKLSASLPHPTTHSLSSLHIPLPSYRIFPRNSSQLYI